MNERNILKKFISYTHSVKSTDFQLISLLKYYEELTVSGWLSR